VKPWWQRRTLRFRLAVWYAAVGTLLLAGFSATLYFYVAGTMARPLSHKLRADLAEVQRRLVVHPDGTVRWDGAELAEKAKWKADDPWFELWDEQDRLVRRMWPLNDAQVERLPPAPPRGLESLSVFRVATNIPLRVLSAPYPAPRPGADWTIRVITIHEPIADALGALRWIIVISLPVVIALLVFSGYTVTRRWLTPLDQMVGEANRITADDLSRRLPVANPHDELGRLATVFNDTLDRLERSFATLDRFVSDASHELRTPLTTLRSVGEVALRRSRTAEEYREIIGSMLEEAQRLQLLIQRLLELGGAEGGAQVLHRERIPLDEYVRACVGELAILAEYRDQTIAIEASPCSVDTDPVIFRQALQNLIDNAIKYSPHGTTITVAVSAAAGGCRVSVADEGPGIAAEDRPRITDRFFRTDSARERRKGGVGLGLAITKAYMRVLGGSLGYEPLQPHGSRFWLALPATAGAREPKPRLPA
jgi:heavy metal sensor kinase